MQAKIKAGAVNEVRVDLDIFWSFRYFGLPHT